MSGQERQSSAFRWWSWLVDVGRISQIRCSAHAVDPESTSIHYRRHSRWRLQQQRPFLKLLDGTFMGIFLSGTRRTRHRQARCEVRSSRLSLGKLER
ncbi:hypothetical protein EJ02DRAFT_5220 [Clathrospora elynae]|uniref:FHA domain-containing protein n=1 Tax=Clathrospora elynae TaxID=706981 RepID=A0A6A5T7W3_9PLEO|nr:hypothetical protein EJ02DRAFT_5220 [Clathrospora elynae]